MSAVRTDHTQLGPPGHGAAAHHVGTHDAGQVRLHRQHADGLPRLDPAAEGRSHLVHRGHGHGAGGELDLRHAQQRPPGALEDEVGERIVEQGRAVAAQAHAPPWRLLVKAIAQQRQQGLRPRKVLHRTGHAGTEAGQRDRGQHRVQRRRFEFVADGAVDGVDAEEVVAVYRLRRTMPAFDGLVEDRRRSNHRVQEGAPTQQAVGVRRLGPQQQCGRVDRAAGHHDVARLDPCRACAGDAPFTATGTHSTARTAPPSISSRSARVCTISVAPRSSAAGIVVTSIDCLALVGQPMPQEPRFQQALTLRRIAAAEIPSLAAPRRSVRCWRLAAPARRRHSAAARPAGTRRHRIVGQAGKIELVAPNFSVSDGVRNDSSS